MTGWIILAGFCCLGIAYFTDIKGHVSAVVACTAIPLIAAVFLFAIAAGVFGP